MGTSLQSQRVNRRNKPSDLTPRACRRCGSPFSGFGQRRYCSERCLTKRPSCTPRSSDCAWCGKAYRRMGTGKTGRYCSKACRELSGRLFGECHICGGRCAPVVETCRKCHFKVIAARKMQRALDLGLCGCGRRKTLTARKCIECEQAARRANQRRSACERCGSQFNPRIVPQGHGKNRPSRLQRFCSLRCTGLAHRTADRRKVTQLPARQCEICASQYQPRCKAQRKCQLCKTHHLYHRTLKCMVCGVVVRKPGMGRWRYCSYKCMNEVNGNARELLNGLRGEIPSDYFAAVMAFQQLKQELKDGRKNGREHSSRHESGNHG